MKKQQPFRTIPLALLALCFATSLPTANANAPIDTVEYIRYLDNADFEDVLEELGNAIVERGLSIVYQGNVSAMLERTAAANSEDAEATTYLNAQYTQFCSSTLTHKATNANPQNIAMCPFVVFIYQTRKEPETIAIGYRPPTLSLDAPSQAVHSEVTQFLSDLVGEVAENY